MKVARLAAARLAPKLAVTTSPAVLFRSAGKENAERLSTDDIKRTGARLRSPGRNEAVLP